MMAKMEMSFRPLSGIQFSLQHLKEIDNAQSMFPSPLGDSILITVWELSFLFPFPLVSVPSRGFNSHYDELALIDDAHRVSVPSRGFNSHYMWNLSDCEEFLVSVPSRGFNSHYRLAKMTASSYTTRFRPLSGIQFSLQEFLLNFTGKRTVSVPSRGFNSHYRGSGYDTFPSTFPSPLGDSILITASRSSIMILALCFRPLSGIQFSLRLVALDAQYCQSFRPLSGIQFSLPSFARFYRAMGSGFRPLSGIQFSLLCRREAA